MYASLHTMLNVVLSHLVCPCPIHMNLPVCVCLERVQMHVHQSAAASFALLSKLKGLLALPARETHQDTVTLCGVYVCMSDDGV